ncbi:MAG: hypothetical protein WCZ23_12475 [Rhodospirillaceae bacterium]
MPRFTARQHILAVLTVLVLSVVFHGLLTTTGGTTTASASASSYGAGHSTLFLPLSAR